MKVNIDACIGCGVCVHVCKYSVLELKCKTEMGLNKCFCEASHQEDCTICGRCIEECLAGAITAK
jgi:NAD-dependent dihydropyrimidine dehydrogenase PreA subunit